MCFRWCEYRNTKITGQELVLADTVVAPSNAKRVDWFKGFSGDIAPLAIVETQKRRKGMFELVANARAAKARKRCDKLDRNVTTMMSTLIDDCNSMLARSGSSVILRHH